jgi:hypothetical protein
MSPSSPRKTNPSSPSSRVFNPFLNPNREATMSKVYFSCPKFTVLLVTSGSVIVNRSRKPKILAVAPLGTQNIPIRPIQVAELGCQESAELDLPSRKSVRMIVRGWVQGEEVRLAEKCRAVYLSAETADGARMRWRIYDSPIWKT